MFSAQQPVSTQIIQVDDDTIGDLSSSSTKKAYKRTVCARVFNRNCPSRKVEEGVSE